MNTRKISLLACIVLALSALGVYFSLPAAAEDEGGGPYWYDHEFDSSPPENDPKPVGPKGSLTFTVGGLTIACVNLELRGKIWNSEITGMAEGEITETEPGLSCNTNLPGCEVEKATLIFPWKLTAVEGFSVDVSNVKVENHFTKECEKYGVPSTTTVTGTATGTFDGFLSALVFEEAGDLKSTPGELAVEINGQINFGTELTVEP